MEVFLLLWDELDDAVGALRMLWRRLAGFLLACVCFAATGFALLHARPMLWFSVLTFGSVLSATLWYRRRRLSFHR